MHTSENLHVLNEGLRVTMLMEVNRKNEKYPTKKKVHL